MTLLIGEHTIGFWYLTIPGGSWIAFANKTATGIRLDCQFRYEIDDQLGPDSQDTISSWAVNINEPENVVEVARKMAEEIGRLQPPSASDLHKKAEVLRGSDSLPEFLRRIQRVPYLTTKITVLLPAGEA